jgi:hypothetical protein
LDRDWHACEGIKEAALAVATKRSFFSEKVAHPAMMLIDYEEYEKT